MRGVRVESLIVGFDQFHFILHFLGVHRFEDEESLEPRTDGQIGNLSTASCRQNPGRLDEKKSTEMVKIFKNVFVSFSVLLHLFLKNNYKVKISRVYFVLRIHSHSQVFFFFSVKHDIKHNIKSSLS